MDLVSRCLVDVCPCGFSVKPQGWPRVAGRQWLTVKAIRLLQLQQAQDGPAKVHRPGGHLHCMTWTVPCGEQFDVSTMPVAGEGSWQP